MSLLGGIGAGLGIVGSLFGGESQASGLRAQAKAADKNARLALEKSKIDANLSEIQAKKVLGEQTADYAASGLGGASSFSVMVDSAASAEFDRLNILYSGRMQSAAYSSEASSLRKAARGARLGSILNAAAMGFMAYGGGASASSSGGGSGGGGGSFMSPSMTGGGF